MFLVEHLFISPTVHCRTHRYQHSSRAAAPLDILDRSRVGVYIYNLYIHTHC